MKSKLTHANKVWCGIAAIATAQIVAQFSEAGVSSEHSRPPASPFTEFDAPLAGTAAGLGTYPLANNDEGSVVGYYIDANSVFYVFLRQPDGKLITLDAPGAGHTLGSFQGTDPNAINDVGAITGNVEDSTGLYHGFIRRPDGAYV